MNLNFQIRRGFIVARIRHLNTEVQCSTGIRLKKEYWNKHTQQIKNITSITNKVDINRYLLDCKERFQLFYLDKKPKTKDDVRELIQRALTDEKASKINLLSFAKSFSDLQIKKINPKTGKPLAKSTISKFRLLHEHLNGFQKYRNESLDFENIDVAFYYDFLEYLKGEYKYSPNTLGKYIQALKTLMNEAISQKLTDNIGFRSKHFKRIAVDAENIYLTDQEVRTILLLDLSDKPHLERSRDVFMIGCYTGLRYQDVINLNRGCITGNYINTMQAKTGERVTIPLLSQVVQILEKYNYSLKANTKINKQLKEVCKLAKINNVVWRKSYIDGVLVNKSYKKYELVSSHTARRSFATNSYQKGIPAATIMKITGHRTEKSFYKYIKLDNKEHADIVLKAWQSENVLDIAK
ncbi:tyrosine-type recombinase/integrase [Marinifilum sp.]|uniref:site-specific integrase n=1 Tax=Marinifilum sp. TaxID=2033137 RepID=UPI003BA9FA1F